MKLHLVSLALGGLFLILLAWHPYPFSYVLKPSGILVLALLAFLSDKPLSKGLALGLAFGAGGDILLDVGFFLAGLVSFLISHLIYIGLFVLVYKEAGQRRRGTTPYLGALFVFAALLLGWLMPGLGDMAMPVTLYLTVITLMTAFAIITPFNSLRLPLGAALFLLSDALIGVSKFRMEVMLSDQLIWVLYFAGQYLITTGFLEGWKLKETET